MGIDNSCCQIKNRRGALHSAHVGATQPPGFVRPQRRCAEVTPHPPRGIGIGPSLGERLLMMLPLAMARRLAIRAARSCRDFHLPFEFFGPRIEQVAGTKILALMRQPANAP